MAIDKIKSLISGAEFNLYKFDGNSDKSASGAVAGDSYTRPEETTLTRVERGMSSAAEIPMPASGLKGISRFKNS